MMGPLLSPPCVFLIFFAAAAVTRAVGLGVHALRNRHREAFEQGIAELARLQSETGVRIEGMRDMLADRQAELHRAVNERLDSVTHHLSQSMTTSRQHTVERLQKLHERLAADSP